MNLGGEVRKTGVALVRTQHAYRKHIGTDMSRALDDTPQRQAFYEALAAFKTAFFAANPEYAPPPEYAPEATTGPGGTAFPALGSEPPRRGTPASRPQMDQLAARTVHNFLKGLATEEFGAAYAATSAPRPFDDLIKVEKPAHGFG